MTRYQTIDDQLAEFSIEEENEEFTFDDGVKEHVNTI